MKCSSPSFSCLVFCVQVFFQLRCYCYVLNPYLQHADAITLSFSTYSQSVAANKNVSLDEMICVNTYFQDLIKYKTFVLSIHRKLTTEMHII